MSVVAHAGPRVIFLDEIPVSKKYSSRCDTTCIVRCLIWATWVKILLIWVKILLNKNQGQIISLTGLLARVSLKQLKIEFYWLLLPAVIGIYMFTKAINLLV